MTDRPIIGLDHIIIAVADLESARTTWNRLGFANAPMGDHVGRATANYCLMFPETYLELLGINQPEIDAGSLGEMLRTRGEGLLRVALGTPDADAAKARLVAMGLHPEGPQDLARPSEEPKGIVRFRNLFIPTSDTAGLGLFLCGHKTPELMRTEAWMRHPNGARAFAGATAIVADVDTTVTAFEKVFGPGSATRKSYGAAVDTGRGTIWLTTEGGFAERHKGAAAPKLPLPAYYALTIAVTDPDATAAHLSGTGVPFERIDPDTVRVAPEHACGVLLELVRG